MATKKQLASLLNEWYESTGALEDPVDCEDEEDFKVCVQGALDEFDLCNGCRWYFSAERSCEKETAGYKTCINRLYSKLLEMREASAKFMKEFEGKEE